MKERIGAPAGTLVWLVGLLSSCAAASPASDPPEVEIEATPDEATATAPPPRRSAVPMPSRATKWPAASSDTEAKLLARKAYKEARTQYKQGNYRSAAEGFAKADFYFPGSAPKYNLAECLDLLGRSGEAIDAYRRFIDSNPSEKYADRVARARKRIHALTSP